MYYKQRSQPLQLSIHLTNCHQDDITGHAAPIERIAAIGFIIPSETMPRRSDPNKHVTVSLCFRLSSDLYVF